MPSRSARSRALLTLLTLTALLFGGLSARAQPVSRHLALGNPSGATADVSQPNNYLISREQYALAYARDRGTPNWVSWHLQASDLGPVPRCDDVGPGFEPDTTLPAGWYQVKTTDYTNSGYNRGHMVPSEDRTATQQDNCVTFLMTNVLPQAPANNQGLWAQLEDYARDLVGQGNEVYVISGPDGSLGTLAGGKLAIPASVWKVLLVLPAADGDDAARVTTQTQVLAVWTPNDATAQGKAWPDYATSVACVQERTGYDFFAAVDDAVEAAIEGAACPSSPYTSYLPVVVRGDPAPPPPTPTPPTPEPPAQVAIAQVEYDPPGDDVVGEFVRIVNSGAGAADMSGWTLSDAAGNRYTFPAFSLAAGAEVRVWTGAGVNGAANLYWGLSQAVWNNSGGDTAILRTSAGVEVARFSY